MAFIIRVALPSSFRAASYHGGPSQLLTLLVSAVRGAAGLARFPICNYCTPRRRWANLSAATYCAVFAMSLLALGRNGRSQAGAEASGLDSLMGWAYTTIEFTLFLWSIAVGLAYDGLAALLTSRVYRAGAGAVLLYLLGTTLIELVARGDGGPELLFFLRMAVFVYCVGYQVLSLIHI